MTEPARLRIRDHALALTFAVGGAAVGIVGAFVEEVSSGAGWLAPFIAAPIIEEGLKPIGVYLLLYQWPRILRSQLYAAALCALSGFLFGVVESVLYVKVYGADLGGSFVLYRFTAPLAMHTIASFTVGLGVNRALLDWANGLGRFPKRSRNTFLAAVLLHAAFNTTAVILTLVGVLDFRP